MLAKNFSKDSRITIMLMAAGTTLICELTSYIIQIIVFKLSLEIVSLIKILAVEILYNHIINLKNGKIKLLELYWW